MNKTVLRRAEQKRKLIEKRGGKCSRCGYCKNASSLDFHHVNPSTKNGNIGWIINFHKFSDAEQEAEKCELLCKNCHSEEHNPELEIVVTEGIVKYKNKELASIKENCDLCNQYAGGKSFCSQRCAKIASRKIKNRPTKEELLNLMLTLSWTQIGRKYGVSDNAIRKWARKDGLIT